jgi:hypothetical protein
VERTSYAKNIPGRKTSTWTPRSAERILRGLGIRYDSAETHPCPANDRQDEADRLTSLIGGEAEYYLRLGGRAD